MVDPRVSRTAAVADLHVPIRPGTNIAYLGGLIKYILDHELYQAEYVLHYTNASYLVDERFSFDEETGYFSGIEDDPARNAKKYDKSTWQYQRDGAGNILKDTTLTDPRCVLQQMKQFYAKYTLDMVGKITGVIRKSWRNPINFTLLPANPAKRGT